MRLVELLMKLFLLTLWMMTGVAVGAENSLVGQWSLTLPTQEAGYLAVMEEAGKLSADCDRQVIDLDMRRRDGRKPENGSVFHCGVRDTEMVAELVLAGELVKVVVEIRIARTKRGSIVFRAKGSDLQQSISRAASCATLGWSCPSRSASGSPDRTSG